MSNHHELLAMLDERFLKGDISKETYFEIKERISPKLGDETTKDNSINIGSEGVAKINQINDSHDTVNHIKNYYEEEKNSTLKADICWSCKKTIVGADWFICQHCQNKCHSSCQYTSRDSEILCISCSKDDSYKDYESKLKYAISYKRNKIIHENNIKCEKDICDVYLALFNTIEFSGFANDLIISGIASVYLLNTDSNNIRQYITKKYDSGFLVVGADNHLVMLDDNEYRIDVYKCEHNNFTTFCYKLWKSYQLSGFPVISFDVRKQLEPELVYAIEYEVTRISLASGNVIGKYDLKDLLDGNIICDIKYDNSLDFSILAVSKSQIISYDLMDNNKSWNKIPIKLEDVNRLALSKRSQQNNVFMALSKFNYDIEIWNYENMEKICSLSGHKNNVNKIVFHPSKEILFSSSDDGTIRIWDCISGKQLRKIDCGKDIGNTFALSEDGELLAYVKKRNNTNEEIIFLNTKHK